MTKTPRTPQSGTMEKVVFTFPGQGAYHYTILRELYTAFPQTHAAFRQAAAAAQRFLGCAFYPLVTATSRQAHDAHLAAHPDLDQLGIFLSEVLIARLLMERGLRPDLLAGHSFGDVAALATAGVYSLETGLEIVCRRVRALQALDQDGRMAALTCGPERARALLAELAPSRIEISVVNHPFQTVVSGPPAHFEALEPLANERGVSVTILKSRYPFHSSYLTGAVAPFREALKPLDFQPTSIPVLISTEQRRFTPGDDLAGLLAGQFVKSLDFQAIPQQLYDEGYRVFVECGAGHIVSKLIRRNLPAASDLIAQPAAPVEEGLQHGLKTVLRLASERGLLNRSEPKSTTASVVSPLLDELSELVQEMAHLTEQANALLRQLSEVKAGKAGEAFSEATAAAYDGEHTPPPPAFAGVRHPSQEGTSLAGSTVSFPNGTKKSPLERGGPAQPGRGVSANDANRQNAQISHNSSQEEPRTFPQETCPDVPLAIVSMGCVLPGSGNPETYWRQICDGVSGVVDLAEVDPDAGRDFVAGSDRAIVSDKTYTLLNGAIRETPYDAALLGAVYSEEEFEALTKGQKLLALATAQSLAGLQADLQQAQLHCILGATADGAGEHDDALFAESLYAAIDALDEPEPLRRAFAQHVEAMTGYGPGAARGLEQHAVYEAVVARLVGRSVATSIVDSACSSSLYAIDLGAKALRAGEADVVLAGGVFAPGPANNALFAQFRGLTPNQSRPLDARADGVVFGDGAGIVALKRLPDALADGDTIHAVIRGAGLSSDGKSPSINVPQARGQSLAMRSAYEQARISIDTIQYIEAHATSTPVGDAVEFASIKQALEGRDPALPPVVLGSVKALIGHTGWVSGVASVIKLCKAFEAQKIPRQYNYDAPNPKIDLEAAPFTIARETQPWSENTGGYPRRAGVNAFGFGGTNAHLILEAFDEAYHRHLCEQLPETKPSPATLAVVGIGSLFPVEGGLEVASPANRASFDRAAFRLPAKKLLLPDVTDHMDASQYLAALAAEKIFDTLPDGWLDANREGVGVVLGLTSKTERGVRANERIFLDRLHRLFTEQEPPQSLAPGDAARLLEGVTEVIKTDVIPSGPYTLPGLMPNVAASRIPSLYNLNGPNIVVDRGGRSLFEALHAAGHLLRHGDCAMALAGGLHAFTGHEQADNEAALLLALTTRDTAQQEGLPVLATLDLAAPSSDFHGIDVDAGRRFGGAQGVLELHEAFRSIREEKTPVAVRENSGSAWTLVLMPDSPADVVKTDGEHTPPRSARHPSQEGTSLAENTAFAVKGTKKSPLERGGPAQPGRGVSANGATPRNDKKMTTSPMGIPANASETQREIHAFVQATPIETYTPDLFIEPADGTAADLADRRILFLIDQPERFAALEQSGTLDALTYTVACPAGMDRAGALSIDLTSDETVAATIPALDVASFDTVIAVKDLGQYTEKTLLQNDFSGERALLDLMFAVCRHVYDRILEGEIDVVAVCLQAYAGRQLDPYTGLTAGFVKSLAREAPGAVCCLVNTDEGEAGRVLEQVAVELAQSGRGDEICYRDGQRHQIKLRPVEHLADGHRPFLQAGSVVLATGGGRGVTAVLAEELLERFGCTVVALGRTDPAAAPDAVRTMDEAAFKGYEAQFYRDELARDPAQKIKGLKRRYERYQAINELNGVIRRLQALPGTFDYRRVDINDAQAVEELVASVYQTYGRIDFVMHGAGIQDSRALPKKSLERFRQIVFTKLGSLHHLYRACMARAQGHPLHVHLLTSAFSYLGNDGQPDYGAANETLNRLAAAVNDQEPAAHWSSMAWLGWASIGMTRGSEFAALAARRRLRGVTKEEGKAIMTRLLDGPPAAAINVMLAEGERQHYQPAIVPADAVDGLLSAARRSHSNSPPDSRLRGNDQEGTGVVDRKARDSANHFELPHRGHRPPRPADTPPVQEGNGVGVAVRPFARTSTAIAQKRDAEVTTLDLSLENAPFLYDHQVYGVPTLPGAFLIALTAEAAQKVRPDLNVVAFEDTRLLKFVKVFPQSEKQIRVDACVVDENREGARVHVRVLSDFYHKSGLLLQKDIVQMEVFVRMTKTMPPPSPGVFRLNGMDGLRLPDPYVMDGSAIQLGGQFDSLQGLTVGETHRKATYQLNASGYPPSPYRYLLSSVIMVDAFWRFGTVQPQPNRALSVYVPTECRSMTVYFDYFDKAALTEPIIFEGVNPREDGDLLHVGPIEAYNAEGHLMLRVEGGLCRRFGTVEGAF